MEYLVLRWLHIVGASVLLGTGAGIAFFMLMAHRSDDAAFVARTAGIAVLADFVFTTSAVVLQPVTGVMLASTMGWPVTQGWIGLSIGLYVAIGALWLPVVWMQIQMRDLARSAAVHAVPLPPRYHRLFRAWLACGVPAFAMLLGIVWLMVAKPAVPL